MPSTQENLSAWDKNYEWTAAGDEWSSAWGGTDAQWFGAILPRIHAYVPAKTILEIAPGHGRWTHYLRKHCNQLIGVDMAPNCVKICQDRFKEYPDLRFSVNDGKTLPMVGDGEVNFAFSFDSLVHAEADALKSYLSELKRVMADDGVAFLHHSNIGNYARSFRVLELLPRRIIRERVLERLPRRIRENLTKRGIINKTHWRAFSVAALNFQQWCKDAGLICVGQELINWGGKKMIDCLSIVRPSSKRLNKETTVIQNPGFMAEAELCRIRSLISKV